MENMGCFWCSLCWFCCLITTLIANAAGSEFSNLNSWHAPTQGWVFQLSCSSPAISTWGMNMEGIAQHFQHFSLFLPGKKWGSSVPWTLNPCATLTVCSHLLSLPLPALSTSRETDLCPVSVLCEKHPRETEEFFGLLGEKELAERRKGGRVEVQGSTKLK